MALGKQIHIDLAGLTGQNQMADISRIDSFWGESVGETDKQPSAVVLDFSRITYLGHEILLYLVAVIAGRSRDGYETKIELPESESARSFLRSWRFVEEACKSSGVGVAELLTEKSAKVWDLEKGLNKKYVPYAQAPWGEEEVLPQSFFAITRMANSGEDSRGCASAAKDRWLDQHVLGVLDELFAGLGSRFGTHVVYETVLNSASHPGAAEILTTSQLRKPGTASVASSQPAISSPEADLSVWDSGQSIPDTLLSAVHAHGTTRSPAFGHLSETFDFHITNSADGSHSHTPLLDSSKEENAVVSREHLMLAAFFLGITKDPYREGQADWLADAPEDILPKGVPLSSGLGLYLVRRTVIDALGGAILYASGSHRLVIKRDPSKQADYVARLRTLRPSDPIVLGNLISIRIPRQSGGDE